MSELDSVRYGMPFLFVPGAVAVWAWLSRDFRRWLTASDARTIAVACALFLCVLIGMGLILAGQPLPPLAITPTPTS